MQAQRPLGAPIAELGRDEGKLETKCCDCFSQSSVRLQLSVGDCEKVRRVLLFNPIQFILGPDFLARYEKSLMTWVQVCYYLIAFP